MYIRGQSTVVEGRQSVGRLLDKMSSELVIRRAFIWPLGGTVMDIRLEVLKPEDEEQFILDNQAAFNFGAESYFNEEELKQQHEEEGQIISRETILNSIHHKGSVTYRIVNEKDEKIGGIILNLKGDLGELEIFFVIPNSESKGVGQAAWKQVEKIHPEIKVWETVTPYFEKRNIHFYVNKLGFHIVEFYNEFNKDITMPEELDGMFKFQKVIKK